MKRLMKGNNINPFFAFNLRKSPKEKMDSYTRKTFVLNNSSFSGIMMVQGEGYRVPLQTRYKPDERENDKLVERLEG